MSKGELKTVGLASADETLESNPITITHYGVQEIIKLDEEEEKDYDAMLFGTVLHYVLEMISSFSIMGLADAMTATRNRYGQQLSTEKFEEIKIRVLELVTNDRFKKLIEGATQSNEQALSFNDELKQIDLLLEHDDHYVVVEYKSSKKYHQEHRKQVRNYKEAIESIKQKYTRGFIIYLLEDGVEFVEV